MTSEVHTGICLLCVLCVCVGGAGYVCESSACDTFVHPSSLSLKCHTNGNTVWEAITKKCDQNFVDFRELLKVSSAKTCIHTLTARRNVCPSEPAHGPSVPHTFSSHLKLVQSWRGRLIVLVLKNTAL